METVLDKIGGPAAVILDAAKRLPRRLPEEEPGAEELAQAIERRLIRVSAQNEGLRWKSAEEVAADLDASADILTCASEAEALAAQLLADASIRFMPGISPRVACALASAVSSVREGLHLWADAKSESAERMLSRGLRHLYYDVSVTTAADVILAREVAKRVLRYIDEDLGDMTPNSLVPQRRMVRELCRAWRRSVFRGAAEVER